MKLKNSVVVNGQKYVKEDIGELSDVISGWGIQLDCEISKIDEVIKYINVEYPNIQYNLSSNGMVIFADNSREIIDFINNELAY